MEINLNVDLSTITLKCLCDLCGAEFKFRLRQVYCSTKCRQKAFYIKNEEFKMRKIEESRERVERVRLEKKLEKSKKKIEKLMDEVKLSNELDPSVIDLYKKIYNK